LIVFSGLLVLSYNYCYVPTFNPVTLLAVRQAKLALAKCIGLQAQRALGDVDRRTQHKNMEPREFIRELREEQLIKASDVERITRSVADAKQNTDFYISHSSLADIEAGSIPSIHKLFSLAISLRVPLNKLLSSFGIDPEDAAAYKVEPELDAPQFQLLTAREPAFRFQLNFDTNFNAQETTLLRLQPQDLANLPPVLQARFDLTRYRYAAIGSKDDSMADLLPPRSLVEIDTTQNTVQVFLWRSLRDRPIYLVWHTDGHTCCWCQVDGKELTLLPHPLSQQPVRRLKMPREGTVVGRVTSAWVPFVSVQHRREEP
jgi:transcriptional regulator with XRE-family HTH domain